MPDEAPMPRHQRREDRNRQLVEWTLGVVGIFWGVWWGFFVNEILISNQTTPVFLGFLSCPKAFFLVASAFYVGYLVFTLVRWMWSLRSLSALTPTGIFLNKLGPLVFPLGGFMGAIYVVSDAFGLGMEQAAYGIALSLMWPTVTYAVLLRRGDGT